MNGESAQNGDFDILFEQLYTELYAIKDELSEKEKAQTKLDTTSSQLDEISVIMNGLKNHPVEYDNQIVRQLIECVKVVSAEQLLIRFKDGTEQIVQL